MRPLLVLFVALCLVNLVFTKPIPEGEEEAADAGNDASEEPKDEETTEEAAGDDAGTDGGDPSADDSSQDKPEEGNGGDDSAKEGGDDAKESSDSDKGKGDAKNDPLETYNKVTGLLDQIKVDNVENGYERSELVADIQKYLRNPVIDVIGGVGDFSKITDCFKSMAEDAKKAIEEDVKAFKECTAKKDGDNDAYHCSQNRSSVQDKISQISSAIKSCVSSNKS